MLGAVRFCGPEVEGCTGCLLEMEVMALGGGIRLLFCRIESAGGVQSPPVTSGRPFGGGMRAVSESGSVVPRLLP